MGIKVTVQSSGQNRISINNTGKNKIVRTLAIPSTTTGFGGIDTLAELNDVDTSDANDGESLIYNENTQKYEVKPIPSIDGGEY
jgi:hypothetical protein